MPVSPETALAKMPDRLLPMPVERSQPAHAEADEAQRRELRHHRQADRRRAQLADRLDHVDHEQRQNGIKPGVAHELREREHQQQEREAVEDQAEAELARDRQVRAAHRHPDPRNQRCERDDRQRVHALEPRDGERPVAEAAVDDLVGEERERAAGLLEEHRT